MRHSSSVILLRLAAKALLIYNVWPYLKHRLHYPHVRCNRRNVFFLQVYLQVSKTNFWSSPPPHLYCPARSGNTWPQTMQNKVKRGNVIMPEIHFTSHRKLFVFYTSVRWYFRHERPCLTLFPDTKKSWKYGALHSIVDEFRGVWKYGQSLSLIFLIQIKTYSVGEEMKKQHHKSLCSIRSDPKETITLTVMISCKNHESLMIMGRHQHSWWSLSKLQMCILWLSHPHLTTIA